MSDKRLSYETFEVSLRQQGDDYVIHVLQSPNGQTREVIQPELIQALRDVVVELEEQRKEMSLSNRHTAQVRGLAFFKKVGQALFDTLFSGDVRSAYDVSLNMAKQSSDGLRIRLRIEPPELVPLPWELMFDRRSGSFLSLSRMTPIVRYIEMKQTERPVVVSHPLRMLMVAASPEDVQPLDVDAEIQRMQTALAGLVKDGLFEVEYARNIDLQGLQRYMREKDIHILHFSGHGYFDPQYGEGYLLLEDKDGHSAPVSAAKLGTLLRDEETLRLVVLNACSTAADSEVNPFSGVAMSLVQTGVPAVVAMQTTISDRAALNFAQEFYQSIAWGLPVDAAVSEGRKAVDLVGLEIGAPEWSIPILFSRMSTGELFAFDTTPAQPSAPVHPPSHQGGASQPRPAEPRQPSARPAPQTVQSRTNPQIEAPPRGTLPSADILSRAMAAIPAGQIAAPNGQAIHVAGFEIDVWPITHGDYMAFIRATGADAPASWTNAVYPVQMSAHPVTGVSWHEASSYAAWVGKRLPTSAEWRMAASGGEARRYPWGDDPDTSRCNVLETRLGGMTPVQTYAAGASPFGVLDMSGNAWEWVLDEVTPRGVGHKINKRMLKGGSWDSPMTSAECSAYISLWPEERQLNVGFRCVR